MGDFLDTYGEYQVAKAKIALPVVLVGLPLLLIGGCIHEVYRDKSHDAEIEALRRNGHALVLPAECKEVRGMSYRPEQGRYPSKGWYTVTYVAKDGSTRTQEYTIDTAVTSSAHVVKPEADPSSTIDGEVK